VFDFQRHGNIKVSPKRLGLPPIGLIRYIVRSSDESQ
jgi:hypothetical protein